MPNSCGQSFPGSSYQSDPSYATSSEPTSIGMCQPSAAQFPRMVQAPITLEPNTVPRIHGPAQFFPMSDAEDEEEYDDFGNVIPRSHGKRRHRTGGRASASSMSYAAASQAVSAGGGDASAAAWYG